MLTATAAAAATMPSPQESSSEPVHKLPPQVVEEALIIAELFNLNEIAALQLLLKGTGFRH